MKVVCSYQEGIPVEPDISTPTRDLARGLGRVGVGIRAIEEICSDRYWSVIYLTLYDSRGF